MKHVLKQLHDTPHDVIGTCVSSREDRLMPYGKRQRRPLTDARTGSGRVVIQGRVDPALRDKANRAAQALDISLSLYLAELIARDELDEHGEPTWRPTLTSSNSVGPSHASQLPGLDLIA